MVELKEISNKSWEEQLEDEVTCNVSQRFENEKLCEETRDYEYYKEGSAQTPCANPAHDDSYNYSHFARFGTRVKKRTIYDDDGISETNITVEKCKWGNAFIDGWGWNMSYECQYKCQNGQVKDYASKIPVWTGYSSYNGVDEIEFKKMEVHFNNGQPIGDYCMPLDFEPNYPFETVKNEELEQLVKKYSEMPESKIFEIEPKKFGSLFEYDIIVEGTWKDNKFTGKAESQHNRGGRYGYRKEPYFKAEWVDGEMSAELKTEFGEYKWHNNICEAKYNTDEGTVKCTLVNGLREGLYVETTRLQNDWGDYYTSSLIEAEYKAGKLHGLCQEYDKKTGKLIEKTLYKGGKKHGLSEKYNKDGGLESETQYKDDKKHGFEKLYNSDGAVVKMIYWQNGKDSTEMYNRLKRIATKHIAEEDKDSEGKDKRKVSERKSKFTKRIEFITETVKDNLHFR